MNLRALLLLLAQAGLAACALLMSGWSGMPWAGTAALGLVCACAIVPQRLAGETLCRLPFVAPPLLKWGALTAWAATLGVPLIVLLANRRQGDLPSFCDYYYAVLAGLVSVILWLATGRLVEAPAQRRWGELALFWAALSNFLWLASAFLQNQRGPFSFGLYYAGALLITAKLRFRPSFLVVQVVNTIILLAFGLPLLEFALHPPHRAEPDPATLKNYYCYDAAKKDRAAFASWWNYYQRGISALFAQVLLLDPAAPAPMRLRPNSHTTLVDSQIFINSRGFRGKEIPEVKGNAYRIVALGESTTFGYTINADDKPWPELLEQFIRERLKLKRPVEVINAGIPSATLPDNLKRFPGEILPVKPDLIICYHGINGFHLLDQALPPLVGAPPPAYVTRPLQVWADAEYRLKLMRYLHRQTAPVSLHPPVFSNLLDTAYARAYRQLIDLAQTNHIRLVLANFPLAINSRSSPELFEFFRSRHPLLAYYIKANVAHGLLVEQLARQYPDVLLVNTRPHLDGEEEKYLDLMHVTQEGDRQLAETFFVGIKGILEADVQ